MDNPNDLPRMEGGGELNMTCARCREPIQRGQMYKVEIVARYESGVDYRYPKGAQPEHYGADLCHPGEFEGASYLSPTNPAR